MPCSDGCYSAPSVSERKEFARITEMLCEACQLLEANNVIMHQGLARWWVDHKEEDRKRIQREIAKAREDKDRTDAMSKLTLYERKLLGIRE